MSEPAEDHEYDPAEPGWIDNDAFVVANGTSEPFAELRIARWCDGSSMLATRNASILFDRSRFLLVTWRST